MQIINLAKRNILSSINIDTLISKILKNKLDKYFNLK